MIHLAVSQVVSELNQYLNLRAPIGTPERVVADSLFDLDGGAKAIAKEKVVASLVNVEQDRVFRGVDPIERTVNGGAQFVRPEVNINIYLLFVANISGYDEALKAISYVISFFQLRPVFRITDPDWDPDGEARVKFELFTLNLEQQNHLWGAVGAKFMPCVVYKAGLLKVRDTQVEAEVGLIDQTSND